MTNDLILNLRSEIDLFVENYINQPGHTLSDPILTKNILGYENKLKTLVHKINQSN